MSDQEKLLLRQILEYNFMLMGVRPLNSDLARLLGDLDYFIESRELPNHMLIAAESIKLENEWLHGQRIHVLEQRVRDAQAAVDAEVNRMRLEQPLDQPVQE